MITQNFAYHAPADLDGVVAALAGHDAVVVGGGTMVVPDLTHGRTSADVVVDLSRAGLSGISRDGATVVVGATTTYTQILRGGEPVPLLRRVAGGITGGPQIRNRGTVGGSACYANPSSEIPAALVALGAGLRLVSAAGVREVAAEDFFTGAFTTARRPDEVLAALVLPGPAGSAFGYHKLKLAESSWPIATAACVRPPGGGLRLALGGVAATPLLVDLESDDPGHVRAAVGRVLTEPWSDVLADGEYRRRVAPVVALRAVQAIQPVQPVQVVEEGEPS